MYRVLSLLSLVGPYNKAIVAAAAGAVVAFLAHHGVDPNLTVKDAVTVVCSSVVTGASVWLTKNGSK